MTRIDFHSNVPNKMAYACRLVRKARSAQFRIVLLTRNRSEMAALDQALWTFSEQDFVPHVNADSALAEQTPVILTSAEDDAIPALTHHQILINLSGSTPEHFARFERMFEIISAEDGDKAAGRDRYRFYKERGYQLSHFVAD